MLEIERRLPLTGLSPQELIQLLETMTDHALAHHGVTQVSGNIGIAPPEDLFQGSLVRPSSVLFAAPNTLDAEDLLRRAAIDRGREHLDAKAMDAWLDEHYPTLGADQCWRCGEDTLETVMSVRDLCPRCESLVGDLGLEEW
jgi:hypothetical protein